MSERGKYLWAEELVSECSCRTSVSGLCWTDVALEEPLSQMARAGLGLEGGSVLVKTFPELRVLELRRQWGQAGGSLGVPAAAPTTLDA